MLNYLDAGTGSMIVTALAGGIAGIGVAFKMGMSRFKAKFSSKVRLTLLLTTRPTVIVRLQRTRHNESRNPGHRVFS